ncbi:MAG: DNA-directed RNA polymerase [Polyangiaceae bacterium]|nr:DNA-directed RNA polymerase [Polyangiaceae bacterium]
MFSASTRTHFPAVALSVLALTTLGGCASYIPFTHELRTEHGLTDDEVKNLQFYVSHDITLRREVESGGRKVTPGHKLLLISGKQIEEVVIPAKTPGVAVKVGPRAIAVSFQPGTAMVFTVKGSRLALENGFLRPVALDGRDDFATRPFAALLGQQFAKPPNPFPGNETGVAPVASDDASGNYWIDSDNAGRVQFAEKDWNAEDNTQQAHLLISSDSLERSGRRELEGR